jgi:hypothetical protein
MRQAGVIFRYTDLAERGRLREQDLAGAGAVLERNLGWADDRATWEMTQA